MVEAVREKRRILERNRKEWFESSNRIHNVRDLEDRRRLSEAHTRHLEQIDKDLLALADEEAAMTLGEEKDGS